MEAIDVANGCSWAIAAERDVIRRATVDPDRRAGSSSAASSDRLAPTSASGGGRWTATSRPSGPSSDSRPTLGSDAPSPRSSAGTTRAIASRSSPAARSPAGRASSPRQAVRRRRSTTPDLGQLIGFDGDLVVSYLACRGLPCPIVSTDVSTDERRILTRTGGSATLATTPHGTQVVHEATTEHGRRLAIIDLDDRERRRPWASPGWALPAPGRVLRRCRDAGARGLGPALARRPAAGGPLVHPPAPPPHRATARPSASTR